MTKQSKSLITLLVIIIMISVGAKVFDQFIEPITLKYDENIKIQDELKLSPSEYTTRIEILEGEKLQLIDKINRQTEQIQGIESSMAFLMKEDVLNKISDAIYNTGATFTNFYVTNEGKIKNDYSVQVRGDIYQIGEFIQNICKDTPGMSVGEFSVREDEETEFINRYFDESNAMMWFDGTVYNADKVRYRQESYITREAREAQNEELKAILRKLPNIKDIKYTMTLTFQV